MEQFLREVRIAARGLWKDRGFSATTVATLALCLAANAAIFAVVDNVLLKPLPFDRSDRLVKIDNKYPGAGVEVASNGVPDYYDRLAGMPALESLAMYRQTGQTLTGAGGEAERVQSMFVTPSFFRVLRVQPIRGQAFTDEQGEIGHEHVVILGYGFWQRVFGGRDDAVGQTLRLGGQPYTIVGVLARDFRFIDPGIELYAPAAFTADDKADTSRHSNNWQQFGRLADGATLAQAQSQVDAINAANFERFPQWQEILKNARFGTDVKDFQADLVSESRGALTLLWGGAIFVLLIGCVNIANLALVRATSRQRELATRQALGAGTGRMVRQALTESLMLAGAGGLAGIGLGWWALKAAPLVGLDQLTSGSAIALDGRVVAFTLGLVAIVGIAVGLMPVAAMRRANVAQIVREEGRSGTQGRGARATRRVLVASQVAFALMLLIGAGVLLASLSRVLHIDPGFKSDHVLTGTVALPASRYEKEDDIRNVTARLLEKIRAVPGVVAAGATSSLPFSGNYSDSVILAEGYQMSPGESLVSPSQVRVSDGYFEAMGVTLVRGRLFTDADTVDRPRVLVVDEQLAAHFWPGQDPIGRRMYQPTSNENLFKMPDDKDMLTVVGVIKPMRFRGLVESAGNRRVGSYYFPMRQNVTRTLGLAVRTSVDPEQVTAALRHEIAQIDPDAPFYGVRTLDDRLSQSVMDRRTPTILAAGFGIVALFLAAIGIYGVLAYQVTQRRREIGIRLALGANSGSIFALVLKEGGAIVSAGLVVGLIGSFVVRRAVQSQLYETGAMDPSVVATVGLALLAVALVACLLPARRASRTDPAIALSDQ